MILTTGRVDSFALRPIISRLVSRNCFYSVMGSLEIQVEQAPCGCVTLSFFIHVHNAQEIVFTYCSGTALDINFRLIES